MKNSNAFEFEDLQGLVCFNHKNLTDTCFMLLNIVNVAAAKQWLDTAPYSNAVCKKTHLPKTALHIAFSASGLQALGLNESVMEGFSDEFVTGMSGDESRSRRLGDVEKNAPKKWAWGGEPTKVPHILLLLYARPGGIKAWQKTVQCKNFSKAFKVLKTLPTHYLNGREPFGFRDGISQPTIDWQRQQSTDPHQRDRYSNLLAIGEIVLGYPNEYGQYTARPLINPTEDKVATILPNAEDSPELKDFGRNGSYLVLRQLEQDVQGFWRFIYKVAENKSEKLEQLASAMVGRKPDGEPLISTSENIPGIEKDNNRFTYNSDPNGKVCPIGAHIRRANPRTGDLPPDTTGFISRLLKILGFGQNHQNDDLVAPARFHRLLRRAQSYGSLLSPKEAIELDELDVERGLQFICLVANISRQFEFVQNAWIMNSKFSGVQNERDPLLGHRKPLMGGESTDQFNRPDTTGSTQKTCQLPQFITMRGGAYFFMPGLRALKYIAVLPNHESDSAS